MDDDETFYDEPDQTWMPTHPLPTRRYVRPEDIRELYRMLRRKAPDGSTEARCLDTSISALTPLERT